MSPDNSHLHQLVFKNLNKKLNKKFLSNIITALIFNLYKLIILSIGSNFFNHTSILISLIIFNISVYLGLYYIFKKI